MKPLSKTKRRGYLIFFALIFLIGAPLFILDAKGYRLNWSGVLKISQTGGLYISADQSGMEIYVDNALVRRTSIVQKSIYVSDLKPGIHEIRITKEGMHSWDKSLKVFPEIVTEARSFLLNKDPVLVEIPKYLNTQAAMATNTARNNFLNNPEFETVSTLFSPPAVKAIQTNKATSSLDKALSGLLIQNQEGRLHISWAGVKDSIPNYFCESDECKQEIIITAASKVLSFDFYPGRDDLLILRMENGVFVSEIDDRSPQNIMPIVSGPGYDFKVKDGRIYLKNGGKFYVVSV